ncbi:unnamed protein product, partial [Rotaria sordida]
VTAEDLESVELVGGSTRISSVTQIVQDFFRKYDNNEWTLDESVAR